MLRAQTVGARTFTQFKLSDTLIDRLDVNNRYQGRLPKIIICDRSGENIEIAFSIDVVVRSRIYRTEMVGKSVRNDPLVIRVGTLLLMAAVSPLCHRSSSVHALPP